MNKPEYLDKHDWEALFYMIDQTKDIPFKEMFSWDLWITNILCDRYKFSSVKEELMKQDFNLMCFVNDYIIMNKL